MRAGRRADRALRGRRAGRLLHHRRGAGRASGPAQGPGGLADPVRQLGRRLRSASPGTALRRGAIRAARPRGAAAPLPAGGQASRLPSPICSGRPTSTSRPVREVAIVGPGGRGRGASARRARGGSGPTSCSRPGMGATTGCPCSRAASRWTVTPPPTCASTSSARPRCGRRRSWRRPLARTLDTTFVEFSDLR